jgi:hypothetical protein
MNNGEKKIVIGSTGNKYVVSKKENKMTCSCPRWTKTSPRENCKHIKSVLTGLTLKQLAALKSKAGKSESKKENNMKMNVKSEKSAKVVVKASLAPKGKSESMNVKKASEVIYKLIAKAPGKFVREGLREKSGLDRSSVAAACKALWKEKKIRRVILKSGSAGPYILYPKKAQG